MKNKLKPYKDIALYSLIVFLIIPIPILGAVATFYGSIPDVMHKAPGLANFWPFFLTSIISVILAAVFYWWRNKGKHESKFFKRIFKNIGAIFLLGALWFQLMPLPFVNTVSHGVQRDKGGTYQWNLEHHVHWQAFGGAKMTSGVVQHFAKTPASKTPDFESKYLYAGNYFILIGWMLSLGLAAGTLLLIRKAKS